MLLSPLTPAIEERRHKPGDNKSEFNDENECAGARDVCRAEHTLLRHLMKVNEFEGLEQVDRPLRPPRDPSLRARAGRPPQGESVLARGARPWETWHLGGGTDVGWGLHQALPLCI